MASLSMIAGSSQQMVLAFTRYRLLFKHPFATAHGMRDGTDSVFVRISEDGRIGYGEATMPPYLAESQESVVGEIAALGAKAILNWLGTFNGRSFDPGIALSAPARAALTTAYIDLKAKEQGLKVKEFLEIGSPFSEPLTMMTLGHSDVKVIALKLNELPHSNILKIKLGSNNDRAILNALMVLDERPFFLDANQGWTHVDQALDIINLVGEARIRGIEQPFPKDRWDLHAALKDSTSVPVFADESIQDPKDLEHASRSFSGVNLKLMKSGGSDIALAMADRAKELGLQVMLGSMSESSLGCGAMAAISWRADLLDLDGPWLIQNDPFQGLTMSNGVLVVPSEIGLGITLRDGSELVWTELKD